MFCPLSTVLLIFSVVACSVLPALSTVSFTPLLATPLTASTAFLTETLTP